MDSTINECVEALKDVRRNMHDDPDPGTGTALDGVIARLEGHLNAGNIDDAAVGLTASEALGILSSILSCCTSIADLMGRF